MNTQQEEAEKAVWRFLYLKTIMGEVPISRKALAASANVSDATIGRARSGKLLKRGTVVKIFDALSTESKLKDTLPRCQAQLLVKQGDENIFDINNFLESLNK